MKVDSITFKTPGGTTSTELRLILYDFSKGNKEIKILSGFVQGEYLEQAAIENLAKLPSRQELLGKVIGSILSPISNLTNIFNGNLIKLINILKNLKLEA